MPPLAVAVPTGLLAEAGGVLFETVVLASMGSWHPQLAGHALHGS